SSTTLFAQIARRRNVGHTTRSRASVQPIGGQRRGGTEAENGSRTPAASATPPEGYFELERGRYGPVYPRTPACYGFSIIAKVKEGREDVVRAYGKTIEETIA